MNSIKVLYQDLHQDLYHRLRQRLRLLYFNLMTRIARDVILEHLTNHLHPDFGSEWREGGEFHKRLLAREVEFNQKLIVMATELSNLKREKANWEAGVKRAFIGGMLSTKKDYSLDQVSDLIKCDREFYGLRHFNDTNPDDNQTPQRT